MLHVSCTSQVTAGVVNLERELASFLRTKKLDPSVAEEANTLLAAALRKPRAMVPGADQEPSLSSRRHAASMHGTNHDEEAVRTCDRQVWHLHQDTVAPKYSASVYDDGDSEIVVSGRVERRGDLDLHLSSPHNPRAEEDVARGAPMEGDHDGELELEEAIEYTSSVRRQWEGRGELDRRKGWPEVRSEQLLKSPAPSKLSIPIAHCPPLTPFSVSHAFMCLLVRGRLVTCQCFACRRV